MSMCKMCGSADVQVFCEKETVRYKANELAVAMAYSVCQNCGREFVTTDQIRENDRAVLGAKRQADGLLTPADIRRAREHFNLTQEQAAEIFGGGRNAFSKYERGEVAQSLAMDRLIRLCLAHRDLVDELRDHHSGRRVISELADVIALQDWQQTEESVNDAVYHVGNTSVRSLMVVSELDVAYGS